MASIFSHGVLGWTSARLSVRKRVPKFYWALSFLLPMVPDLDVLGRLFGIAYGDCLGHRGAFHSLVFSFILSFLIWFFFVRRHLDGGPALAITSFMGLFIGLSAHGLVDATTNGGLGVGFFWPISCERFFFIFRPIEVSPISMGRFFEQTGRILKNEALWIWLPCGLVIFMDGLLRKLQRSPGKSSRGAGSESEL